MRRFAFLSCVLLIGGCTPLHQLKTANPDANDFNSSLASEYQAYAESESEQGRLLAAEKYAKKGLRALNGETVEPELPDTALSTRDRDNLASARAKLSLFLTDDIKRVAPQKVARAQLLFDCWQRQLAKDFNQDVAPCGDEFWASLDEVRQVAEPSMYDQESHYNIRFGKSSTKLSKGDLSLLSRIARKAGKHGVYAIDVKALTGRTGHKLSEQRLRIIRGALIKAGVPAANIWVNWEDNSKKVELGRKLSKKESNTVSITLKTHS